MVDFSFFFFSDNILFIYFYVNLFKKMPEMELR